MINAKIVFFLSKKTPTIYWGYKMEDAGVLQALSKDASGGKEKADSWIVLRSTDEESIEYFSSMGFQIIEADTIEFLKYLGQLKKVKSLDKSKLLIENIYYQLRIVLRLEVLMNSTWVQSQVGMIFILEIYIKQITSTK